MNELVPVFDFQRVFITPWTTDFQGNIWVVLMGFFAVTACGLVGQYLVLRRMALVGDAISHSVLPGIVIAFLLLKSRSSGAMFLGALFAAVLTTVLIEFIQKKSRVKQDAAIGIVFTSLFAVGVIMVSLFTSQIDLDLDCVLHGEIINVPLELPFVKMGGIVLGPSSVVRMAVVSVITAVLVLVFYRQLLVSSFDPGLAGSLGVNASVVHYALMGWLSVVVVSCFDSVGAILVVAMLILPATTASMVTDRLPWALASVPLQALLSAFGGFHLATWLNCAIAPAMVVAACGLFALAWVFGPVDGQLAKRRRRRANTVPDPVLGGAAGNS